MRTSLKVTAGQPGILSLGAPGVLKPLLTQIGSVDVEQRMLALSLRMPSATDALRIMQEGFGALSSRRGLPRSRSRRRLDGGGTDTQALETTSTGFVASGEVLVASGAKPS